MKRSAICLSGIVIIITFNLGIMSRLQVQSIYRAGVLAVNAERAVVITEKQVSVIDLNAGKIARTLQPDSPITDAALTPQQTGLILATQNGVSVWDLSTGEKSLSFAAPSVPTRIAAILPEKALVLLISADGSQGGFYDLKSGEPERLLEITPDTDVCADFYPVTFGTSLDGTIIFARGLYQVCFFDGLTGKALPKFTFDDMVLAFGISNDGRYFLIGSRDYTAFPHVYETATRKLLYTTGEAQEGSVIHPPEMRTLLFTPDANAFLAADESGNGALYTISNGTLIQSFFFEADSTQEFIQNGAQIISLGASIQVWDTQSGALLQSFGSYVPYMSFFSLTSDQKIVAALNLDTDSVTLEVWLVETGELLHIFRFDPDSLGASLQ